MFLGKAVLKICSKFTREHPCRSVISIKLLCNFIEITLQHGCSLINLLHFFRTPFLRTPLGGCFSKYYLGKATKVLPTYDKVRIFKIRRIDISILHCVIFSQLLLLCFPEVVSMDAFLNDQINIFCCKRL